MLAAQKNDLVTLSIDSYNTDGAGVGRLNGSVVFVPGTIAGEKITAQIIKITSQYAVAKLVEIIEPSENRVTAPCPVYDRCGGCALQHMSSREQQRLKSQRIMDCFARIGHIPLPQSPIIHGMEDPFRYRNKAAFPVVPGEKGVGIGLFAKRSHRIVDVDDCLLQHEDHADIVRAVRDWMKQYAINPYDEQTHQGTLRHLVTRSSGGGYLICLVVAQIPQHTEDLVQRLLAAGPMIVGIVLNINTRHDNVILSDKEQVVYGNPRIIENLFGLQFSVSIQSFLQVNPIQTEKLYQLALDFAQLHGEEQIVDAYCGVGTMTLLFSKHAKTVHGIECVAAAIEDAKQNAQLNGIDNVSFECAFAEKALPKLVQGGNAIDLLLLDPPRKGCDPAVIRTAIDARIPKIVYVSCDPATLARDAALLVSGGYTVQRVEGVDMFCQTSHVETVCLLKRT